MIEPKLLGIFFISLDCGDGEGVGSFVGDQEQRLVQLASLAEVQRSIGRSHMETLIPAALSIEEGFGGFPDQPHDSG